jgi:predicted MFS family arabinose efflux permease
MQLTLPLNLNCGQHIPEWVRLRLDSDLAKNTQRWQRMKTAYREIASALESAGLDCVVLKGFSHCPRFVSAPQYRWQGDLDLLLTGEQVMHGREIAVRLGYEPLRRADRYPTDHLPILIRKTGWRWRGDYFDLEMPISLELHFRLWDEHTEGFSPNGLQDFWGRRRTAAVDDLQFLALHPADSVGNATLHLLRHLLRGSLRACHVYELAWMLHHSIEDRELWSSWRKLHDESLRPLEAICFSLAERWFGCQLPGAALEEVERLAEPVKRWFDLYSASPLENNFRPNKDELWLHWSLLDSTGSRLKILRRRLLPEQLPGPLDAVHIPEQQRTLGIRLVSAWRYFVFATSRAAHHLRALPSTTRSAFRWFGGGIGLGPQYWRFFFAEGFFDFGMFIFVFLYNLYLLQIGFRENFIGLVSGVMTAGSVAGSLLAAVAIQRFGLRKTLLISFALTALLSVSRAYTTIPPVLLGLALAAGITSSAWAVAFSPAIAHLTTAKNRAVGFSFASSVGIAIGVIGSQAAGRLPGWLVRLHWAPSTVASYREAMLAGCVMIALAIWAFSGVKMDAASGPEARKFHRPSPLVIRFLIAMFVWNIGTGALNPFFNVFFSRRVHMPLEQIGTAVSVGQIAQVVAILAAPLVFRRYGLTRGISGMQFATGLALVALAAASGPAWAAAGYATYMMTQYMSEPGMFTLLMEGAPVQERGSASALNFLVSFAGQAIAAAVAGQMLARFGYPPVFAAAAVICGVAALLFRVLLNVPKQGAPSSA